MNTSFTIAFKVFVRPFFQENATFFLFVLGICAGFMRGPDHVALAEFFVGHSYLVLLPFIFWTGYALKILNFNKRCLTNTENQFFYQLIFFYKTDRIVILSSIVFTQLLPVILYGIFLIVVAAKRHVYDSIFVVMMCLVFLSITLLAYFQKTLHHPDQNRSTSYFMNRLNRLITRPYPLFSIEWLARKKTLMLFSSKVFTILTLIAISTLYKSDSYDSRLMGMGIVVAISLGAQLMFEVHGFDNQHFAIVRQLPITISKRMFYLLITIIVLILPECGVIINYFPAQLSILEIAESIFFLTSGLFFWYGIFYRKNSEQDKVAKMMFAYAMTSIVLILFRIPVWVLAGTQFFTSAFLWRKYYYRFEYTEV